MDAVGPAILERELAADAVILREAGATAVKRLRDREGGFAEAAACLPGIRPAFFPSSALATLRVPVSGH